MSSISANVATVLWDVDISCAIALYLTIKGNVWFYILKSRRPEHHNHVSTKVYIQKTWDIYHKKYLQVLWKLVRTFRWRTVCCLASLKPSLSSCLYITCGGILSF